MTQEYLLVSVPENRADEVISLGGTILAPLPDGTYLLDIQAYWQVTDPDGQFRGGAAGYKAEMTEGAA